MSKSVTIPERAPNIGELGLCEAAYEALLETYTKRFVCARCKKRKAPDQFYFWRGRRRSYCMACLAELSGARWRKNHPLTRAELIDARIIAAGGIPGVSKACSRCRTVRPLEQFYRQHHERDGRASACKSCRYVKVSK